SSLPRPALPPRFPTPVTLPPRAGHSLSAKFAFSYALPPLNRSYPCNASVPKNVPLFAFPLPFSCLSLCSLCSYLCERRLPRPGRGVTVPLCFSLAFLCALCVPISVTSVLPSLFAFLPLPPKRPQKLTHRQRINHISLLQPPSPRHPHPVPHQAQIPRIMRIRRNHHLHPAFLAHPQIHILQIQPVRIRIALHRHAMFRASRQHLLHVVIYRLASQQHPPRWVPYDLRVRILDCRQHPL